MFEKQKLNEIAKKFYIDIIYAFGSNAKNVVALLKQKVSGIDLSTSSDLDIGVKPVFGKLLSIKEKVRLSMELEDIFSVSKVDLVVLPEADPFLAANIVRGERIYCKDKYRADEYDLYILRRAGDFIPLERERLALIMEAKEQ